MRLKNNPYVRLLTFCIGLILLANFSSFNQIDPISYINLQEEVPQNQSNYENEQLNQNPYVWDTLGYSGNSNASVAIIGSGIDSTHIKFGYDAYAEKDFSKKIIGWKDFVNESNLYPVDPNGLSTFTATSAYGNNDSYSSVPLDAENRTSLTLGGLYLQTELFSTNPGPGTFRIKLGTFFIDQSNANINLNASYDEFSSNYIQNAKFQIKMDETILNETNDSIEGEYSSISYTTSSQPSIYDIYFTYRLGFASPANFSINALLKIPLEKENDFSGIAPETKLIALRILDRNLDGNISSLISALNWTKNNRDDYHIVGVQIDLGNYQWDTSESEFTSMIEQVIENGIMIFLPAGDNGVVSNAINPLVTSEYPIVVGAINDASKLTFYSSMGKTFVSGHKKIDILAPGGSFLEGHRTIIAADTNTNDLSGYLNDQVTNDSTSKVGTSIATAYVAAAYNLLIESIGGYSIWENLRSMNATLGLKSRLLMTATELNQAREDDPETTIVNESGSVFSPTLDRGGKDTREGFGLLNIPAAIESIIYQLNIDSQISDNIVSSVYNNTGIHSFARFLQLSKNEYYNFTVSFASLSDLDIYIYSNKTDLYGDPVLVQSSTMSGIDNESVVFGLEQETGVYIVVIKAISGEPVDFTLTVSHLANTEIPTLTDHSVGGIQGFNDTLDTFEFIINYTDLDGLPPITLDLNISGFPELISFVKVESDDNFTDGCLFSAQFHFYEIGEYQYHIVAWDGLSEVRAPTAENFTLQVLPIQNAIYNNYSWGFSTMDNWEINGGWNNISQIDTIDPRENIDNEWNALYFGDLNSVPLGDYSYENIAELSISTALSPQFWLNLTSEPNLKFGSRISITSGDYFLINIRSNRTGSWDTLESFTNYESEWNLLEYDLSKYLGTYIQIQFVVVLDLINDEEQNKGIMIDDFEILHHEPSNFHPTYIFNESVYPESGPKYQKYQFSVIIGDQDGTTPDFVYLEIDQENYTMFNIYGNFDSSYVLDNMTLVSGGITFAYDIYLATISNSSFRFHVIMNGTITTSQFHDGPEIDNNVNPSFPFYGTVSNMSVYGTPRPNPTTIWATSSNSFHYIESDNVWYSGVGVYEGYGYDWNVYLITPLVYIPPSNEETDRVYLWFEHQLTFDSTLPTILGNDYARIMISSDYGDHWYELELYEDNVAGYQAQKIDLWNYKGKEVLIRFEFHSDNTNFLPLAGTGWYIRNIEINVDVNIDKEPPRVIFTNITPNMIINETFTIEITILDPSGIDDNLVTLYINTVSIDDAVCEDGVIIYQLDTTQFRNGNTTISVLAYDLIGNYQIVSTYVTIQNEGGHLTWVYIIIAVSVVLIAIVLILYIRFYKPAQRKKELTKEMLSEEDKQRILEEQRARELEEMRIREEAEMATPESEALKPFKYKCTRCSKEFENKEYIWSLECPDCKTDTLVLEYQCKICGKYYHYDMPGEYYCKDCNIKLLK